MTKFDNYIAKATEELNNGFTSKAGQKSANDWASRAFSSVRDAWHNALIDAAPKPADRANPTQDEWNAMGEFYAANETPFDLHNVRDRHLAIFDQYLPGSAAKVRELVELRAAIKAAPVVAPMKDAAKVEAARIVESIKARMDRLQVRYLEAIDSTTIFEDGFVMKGLSANSHYVTNEHGTTFLRTFFYLYGKLTPLNLILAAAQEARREAEANGTVLPA